MFTSFLDLSKAFDSVNHVTLFKKLVDLKFPGNVVKLLIYWYAKQEINNKMEEYCHRRFSNEKRD